MNTFPRVPGAIGSVDISGLVTLSGFYIFGGLVNGRYRQMPRFCRWCMTVSMLCVRSGLRLHEAVDGLASLTGQFLCLFLCMSVLEWFWYEQ